MTQQLLITTVPGTPVPEGGDIINDNFTELYASTLIALTPTLGAIVIGDGTDWISDLTPTLQGDLTMAGTNQLVFGTTNQFTVAHDGTGLLFTGSAGSSSARGFTFSDGNMAFGDAIIDPLSVINADFTPLTLPLGQPVASISLNSTIDNGNFALPSAILGETHVTGGTNILPISFRAEMNQDSNNNLLSAFNFTSKFLTKTGTTGTLGPAAYHFQALESATSLDGGGAAILAGLKVQNQGSAKVASAISVDLDKQINATVLNGGVVLRGDGSTGILLTDRGAATVYGVAQDAWTEYVNTQGMVFAEITDNKFRYKVSDNTDITVDFEGTANSGQYLWKNADNRFEYKNILRSTEAVEAYNNVDVVMYAAMRA